jgi:hypothetical protein
MVGNNNKMATRINGSCTEVNLIWMLDLYELTGLVN